MHPVTLTLFAFAILIAQPVHAYLDPGAGSLIIQGIVAAIAVVGVTARAYWQRLRSLFGMQSESPANLEPDEPENPED
ncbi:MAG: hypothetical protein QF921_12510 [Pseudomonadales bacterium]|jgi:hypothetical protein|nr:hypothetical protein [Pseudomonadales bacterium]MDP6470816.1 hypothetical protein [Pseudomonadales bacterium]MDP6825999.1 hypothetical protein [Pseudomonadales bacterium]MDP6972311.1 hypothetical protein [Pseudomonadales bacterium]|tara:strand:- start:1104 stop:1337 length:234 start_codon:yes stop_codon:yes gene_type:complete